MQALHATHYSYLESMKLVPKPYPQRKEQLTKTIHIRNLHLHLLLGQALRCKSCAIYCTEETLQMLPRGTTHRRSKFSSHLKIEEHETSQIQSKQEKSTGNDHTKCI